MRRLLRRMALYGVAAFAAITINFALPRALPGDPAAALFARFRGELHPEALQHLRAALGYTDAPVMSQFWTYLRHVARGDLGTSVTYFPSPVASVVGRGLLWTLVCAGTAVLISFAAGTLIGMVAAWRRGGWLDALAPPMLTFLGAFPYFWLAMLGLFLFGFVLGWFPLGHAHSDATEPAATWTFVGDVACHAVLPAGSIVLATLGGWVLGMRNTMVSVLGSDFIALARLKGLHPARVMCHYAARNALLPNVTAFGMALGFVVGGSLLTEVVFSYPGQGYLLVQAVRNQDYPLMQGVFLVITLAVLGANFLVDVAYVWLDPRARVGGR